MDRWPPMVLTALVRMGSAEVALQHLRNRSAGDFYAWLRPNLQLLAAEQQHDFLLALAPDVLDGGRGDDWLAGWIVEKLAAGQHWAAAQTVVERSFEQHGFRDIAVKKLLTALMKAEAWELVPEPARSLSSQRALQRIALGLAAAGRAIEVQQVLHLFEQASPKPGELIELQALLALVLQRPEARQLVNQNIQLMNHRPEFAYFMDTFKRFGLKQWHQWLSMRKLADIRRAASVESLMRWGYWAQARHVLLHDRLKRQDKRYQCRQLFRALVRRHHPGARHVLALARRLGVEFDGSQAALEWLPLLTSHGHWRQAWQFVEYVTDPDQQTLVLGFLLVLLARAGRWAEAEQALARMTGKHAITVEVPRMAELPPATAAALQAELACEPAATPAEYAAYDLLGCLAAAGRWEQAHALLARIADAELLDLARLRLIQALAADQRWAAAETLLAQLADPASRDLARHDLALARIAADQPALAQTLVDQITTPPVLAAAQYDLALAWLEYGDLAAGSTVARAIAHPLEAAAAQRAVALAHIRAQHPAALDMVLGAWATARQRPTLGQGEILLQELVLALLTEWNLYDLAVVEVLEAIIASMQRGRLRVECLCELAVALNPLHPQRAQACLDRAIALRRSVGFR